MLNGYKNQNNGRMEIEIKATIKVNSAYGDLTNEEELEWFKSILADKKNTSVVLWSNDIGDEIGNTNDFEYKLTYSRVKKWIRWK